MRLLLVDADRLLSDAVRRHLGRVGYALDWVPTTLDFIEAVNNHRYDLVLLDHGLPDSRGEDLLQHLHQIQARVPVIVVSAQASVLDRVCMLNSGADDFLSKPFDLDELAARIRSVQRRLHPDEADASATVHGQLKLFPLRFAASWNGQNVALTLREFGVLEVLVRRKDQVLSRNQIEESLYRDGAAADSNTIDVYIHLLRRKFCPSMIHTIRGVGYQLAPVRHHA
jgi:DNA-binding response OmpR family regulator